MARDDLHFRLRIPEDLKKRIEAEADLNNRSMTAEIITRLEQSFSGAVDEARIARLEMENRHLRTLYGMTEKQLKLSEQADYHAKALMFFFADAIKRYADGEEDAIKKFIEWEKQEPFLDTFKYPKPDETDADDDVLSAYYTRHFNDRDPDLNISRSNNLADDESGE